MKKAISITASLLYSLATTVMATEINMQEGMWEIQTKIEMQGMPYAVPPTSHSQCITKEEMVPGNKAENSGCEVTDITNTGDTVTWAMRCDQQGTKTTSKGSVTYSGSTFKGEVIMQTQYPGSGSVMTISSYMDGKYKGACQ